ncbi:MAG: glutamine amidotransferase [Kiritimatiellae bacterium]|nr:glutamine amidotransferase [Kiritimatiellia bacterium]
MIIYDHIVPTVAIVMGVLTALCATFASYWFFVKRDLAMASMISLRFLFFLLLGWCLLMPGEKTVQTLQMKSRFVVLLDTSSSMTMTPVENATNRWQVAQSVLQMPWVANMVNKCDLDIYAFAGDLGPRMSSEEATALEADGNSTLLRDALKKTVGRYSGLDVTGCLLLSDGLETREAFKEWSLEKRPFPIFSLPLEKGAIWEEEPDIRIEAVSTPGRVTVGWQSELKVVISGQGTKGQPFPVQLFKDEVMVQQMESQLPESGGSREVLFKLDHQVIGLNTYRVLLPQLPEEKQIDDNESSVVVQVQDAKNRLMYVEGPPRWESKYLSRVLRESKQVSPAIFLKGPKGKFMTYGVSGDVAPDMNATQLSMFKIVILGNLSGEELGAERARALVKFVDAGGSLILLGGTKGWAKDGFATTPLKELLPASSFSGKALEGTYPVSLTDQGRSHAAFGGDAEFWDKVPSVLSLFHNVKPSAAARVLVESKTSNGPQPMILAQNFGQGKVVAIFSDSLWKWQLSADALKNKPYPRFWHQLLSWLSPQADEMDGKVWDIFLDREECFLGEEIEITARWVGADRPPAGTVVNAEITFPDKRKLPFTMESSMDQAVAGKVVPAYSVKFRGEEPGMFSVMAISETGGQRIESEGAYFSVKPYSPESRPRPPDQETIKAITVNSEGAFYNTAAELNSALVALYPKQLEQEISEYKTYWQRWAIIGMLILLIATEWIIRKFQNLT